MPILTTHRLSLRELIPSDADALLRIFGDPEAMAFAPMVVTQDRAVALATIEWHQANYRHLGYSAWAVMGREGDFVGLAGLLPHDIGTELFCSLIREHWGRGYATEVLAACRDLAFGTFGVDRLISIIQPDHARAIALARRLGMADVGEMTYWHRTNRLYELRNGPSRRSSAGPKNAGP